MRSLRRWYADPEVTRLSRHRQQPVSEDEFDEVIARRVGRAEVLAFAIYERVERDLERLVGSCTLATLDQENGSASFHIVIGEPDARGRGFPSTRCGNRPPRTGGTLRKLPTKPPFRRLSASARGPYSRPQRGFAAVCAAWCNEES